MAPRSKPSTEEEVAPDVPTPAWINPFTGEPDPIHVLLAKVLGELPAIPKDQRNESQKFNFRGIDDVLDELNPLLGKYGVFFVPTVINRIESDRNTKSGGNLYVVNLHVRYTFYGPAGDHIEATAWGEGTDSGDKATPKAMTGAMKNVLFQVFAISVKEVSDNESDRLTPPATISAKLKQLMDRFKALPDDLAEKLQTKLLTDAFNDPANGTLLDLDGDDKWLDIYDHLLTAAEKKASEQPATEPAVEQEPDPNPEHTTERPATPVSTPAADPPPSGPVTEPEPENTAGGDDEDTVYEWDEVAKWSTKRCHEEFDKLKNPPMLSGKEKLDELRELYWRSIGGTFEGEDFPCPVEDCTTFPYTSQEDLDAHMAEAHGVQEPASDEEGIDHQAKADDPEPSSNGSSPEMVNAEMLAVIQPMLAGLKGENARAYATYRRKNNLPSKPDDMTAEQAIELVDYLESLNA